MKSRRRFMSESTGLMVGLATSAGLSHRLFGASPAGQDAATDGKASPLKILILGGTGQLGPFLVERARERGHAVTLFNRGQSGPGLFPEVERIQGDRYTDLTGLSKAVAEGRTWDAVIDTFTYLPKTVTEAMDILRPAMKQFVVISTISVYASNNDPDADEDAALALVPDEVADGLTSHTQVGPHYGAMKARVEKAAEAHSPGKVTTIRPGLIVGPRDTTGRYSYWPIRGSEGGRMIAPGTGDDFVQIIDVRDLADFTILCVENRTMGTFNAVTPGSTLTMRDVVDSVRRVGKAGTEPVWIPAEFLATHGVNAWQQMPAWVPNDAPGYAGFGRMSTARSVKAGLKTRGIDDTNEATLAYYRTRGEELAKERGEEFAESWRKRIRGGLASAKEVEVLEAWDQRTP